MPSVAFASITTFGSPLSVPATLNTSENLNYPGVDTQLPGAVVHTTHYGADTALWNTTLASGSPTAPADGQVVKLALEGCAQRAANGPAPLTQIHFQIYAPQTGGGVKVELTSGAFDIPVCGQNSASGSTVSTYEPVNLCVNAGDYVGFNDEGGYEEAHYRSGVPYEVIGSVQGSVMDSFIKGGGTNDGATFSPSETSAMEGFATSRDEELMLQATLGTGPDARYVCPGGTKEAPIAPSTIHAANEAKIALHPVMLLSQQDGVNHARTVGVAVYCRLHAGCAGTAMLSAANGRLRYGSAHLSVTGKGTYHVSIRLSPAAMTQLRKHRGRLTATLTVTVGGKVVHQHVTLYI